MSRSYAIVYYIYEEEFRYGVILVEDGYKSALYQAYYELLISDKIYNISVIEADELYYLENAEAAYDDPTYYASETQDAIENCDIVNIIESFKT